MKNLKKISFALFLFGMLFTTSSCNDEADNIAPQQQDNATAEGCTTN
jgi:hypothetical protein